jgi:transcriptional regulator with XRE-family HTH domain
VFRLPKAASLTDFGGIVERHRIQRGLSVIQLARALGIGRSTVYRQLTGQSDLSDQDVLRYADILKITPHHLTGISGVSEQVIKELLTRDRHGLDRAGPSESTLSARLVDRGRRFIREIARMQATDDEIDYAESVIFAPETAKLVFGGADGRPASLSEQEHQFELQLMAVRAIIERRINDRKKEASGE